MTKSHNSIHEFSYRRCEEFHPQLVLEGLSLNSQTIADSDINTNFEVTRSQIKSDWLNLNRFLSLKFRKNDVIQLKQIIFCCLRLTI